MITPGSSGAVIAASCWSENCTPSAAIRSPASASRRIRGDSAVTSPDHPRDHRHETTCRPAPLGGAAAAERAVPARRADPGVEPFGSDHPGRLQQPSVHPGRLAAPVPDRCRRRRRRPGTARRPATPDRTPSAAAHRRPDSRRYTSSAPPGRAPTPAVCSNAPAGDRELVHAQLVLHRHVRGPWLAPAGLEVDDPDPALTIALDPVSRAGEVHPFAPQLDLAGRSSPRCRAAPGPSRSSCQARNRSIADSASTRSTADSQLGVEVQLVPDLVEMVRQPGPRGIGGVGRAVLGEHVHHRAEGRGRVALDSPRASRARNQCRGQAEDPAQLAARQPDRLHPGATTGRADSVSSAIPHQRLGPRRAPAAAPSASLSSLNRANRAAAASRRLGGASASVAVRRSSATKAPRRSVAAGAARARAGPRPPVRRGTATARRPSPSVPATAVTTSRRRARVQAT